MPAFRYQALGPLPSPGGTPAFLGLAVLDEQRAQPVVLVWVPADIAQDIEKSERIQRETERAALLEHPHIVRVYGFARLEQGLARVVEFADGESLRRILEKNGPLPTPLAARLIADTAQGVHYAHLAGNDDGTPLLHGDIRPETLLVAYNGLCKISGYGASAFAPKESRARNLRVAPEQVLGGRAAMNVQTDVYLLGATLFELLTGKAPFEDEPNFEQAVLSKELELSAYGQIPRPVAEVIQRALAKRAADRFPSALVLREALELAVQPLPSHEEIAAWLSERFPDNQGARAARQRMIDAAIASFARQQWQKQSASGPSTQPPFPAVAPAVTPVSQPVQAQPPPPPPAPAPAPKPPAAAPARQTIPAAALEDERIEPKRPRQPGLATIVVVLFALAGAALIYVLSKREGPREPYPPELTTRVEPDAGTAPVAVAPPPADAGAPVVDAGTAVTAVVDAGTVTPAAEQEPAKPSTVLALTVEPRVNVEIDGQAVGRSPIRVPLARGRHKVRLFDRGQGIDLTRFVMVEPSGVTNEEIYVQKGFVAVSAPPGSVIEIDGKNVGRAPLKGEVSVYEGSHRIDVKVGANKWGENFTIKPNQRVYFDVGPQYE